MNPDNINKLVRIPGYAMPIKQDISSKEFIAIVPFVPGGHGPGIEPNQVIIAVDGRETGSKATMSNAYWFTGGLRSIKLMILSLDMGVPNYMYNLGSVYVLSQVKMELYEERK